ncbi:MAG: hypothetical protein ACRCZF_11355, partial [Gemmataceae bacterium]
ELVGLSAQYHSQAKAQAGQMDRLQNEQKRKDAEAARLLAEQAMLAGVLEHLSRDDADLQERITDMRQKLEGWQQQQLQHRDAASALQPELDTFREERGTLRGRIEALESLEKSREGIGAGSRELLEKLQADPRLQDRIYGLVADLLTVPGAAAAAVECALGPRAEYFVVQSPAALDAFLTEHPDWSGRVGFMALLETANAAPVGSLAAFVTVDRPELAQLPGQLLGAVRHVADLSEARAWMATHPTGRALTADGTLLEADGTLTVGPLRTEAGLLSRKTELRERRLRWTELDQRIHEIEIQQEHLREQASACEAPMAALQMELVTLSGEAGSLRDRLIQSREKSERLGDHQAVIVNEL